MAKTTQKTIIGVKRSSIAMFEATFGAAVGLFVAVMYSLNSTVAIAESTNSVLKGLSFGLATGVIAIIVVPLIYFGIGWVVGYVHGWLFNCIAQSSGGITVKLDD